MYPSRPFPRTQWAKRLGRPEEVRRTGRSLRLKSRNSPQISHRRMGLSIPAGSPLPFRLQNRPRFSWKRRVRSSRPTRVARWAIEPQVSFWPELKTMLPSLAAYHRAGNRRQKLGKTRRRNVAKSSHLSTLMETGDVSRHFQSFPPI